MILGRPLPKLIEQPIPTNIISGFLGVGKTTVIQHLLSQKPENERWAVLVNEFGEIGIDGAFLSSKNNQIFVKEVPGGCMCCTSGLPMQIALNQLIQLSRPDRLLIEPTGLGHPKEVLDVFRSEHYQSIIQLNATFTLVDARKVTIPKYRENEIYRQQIEVADIVLAAKSDLYESNELEDLTSYIAELGHNTDSLRTIEQGHVDLGWLDQPARLQPVAEQSHHHHHDENPLDIAPDLNEQGFARADNKGQGFNSAGWVFHSEHIFEYDQIFKLFSTLHPERLKAVVITDKGIFIFNFVDGVMSCREIDESIETRIEIIDSAALNAEEIQSSLLAASSL